MAEVLLLTTQRDGPAAYMVHAEPVPGRTACGIGVGDTLPADARPSAAERAEMAEARRCHICFPLHNRSEVRQVACPACGAQPGEHCTGMRDKRRESNHREREQALRQRELERLNEGTGFTTPSIMKGPDGN